jgi:hypothetical protein
MSMPTYLDRRIDADVPCVEYGYNLRTMMADAACPECGRSAQISPRTWRDEIDDHKWLRCVRSGIVLIFISLVCEIARVGFLMYGYPLGHPLSLLLWVVYLF